MAKKLNNPKWWKAIEIYCTDTNMPLTRLSEQACIPYDTIKSWFKKKEFLDSVWSRFLEIRSTLDLIDVYDAMVVEAKNGNKASADFVFAQHDKLEKRMEGMASPYAQFVQINNINSNNEMQDPMMEVQSKVHDKVYAEVHEIPNVTIEESNKTYTKPYKKQKVDKEKRNALMKLKRRAKKVGLATLGTGRPTKTERSIWLARLEKLEEEKGIKPPSP